MHRIVPAVPYFIWTVVFGGLSTALNLRGIRTGVHAQQLLLVLMTVVIIAVVGLALHYVSTQQGVQGLITSAPFFHRDAFDLPTIATATSLAALTYIGFDAVTTLAEEVENPERNMVRATVWVCLITGLVSILLVYLGQLVWPAYQDFKDFDTAFLDVAQRIGGTGLFSAMVIVLVLATFGAALTGQSGAARVLFAMGRSGAFPQRLFAHLDTTTLQPSYNVAFVGLAALIGALTLSFEAAGELLNFGAFLAFMGVNLAALRATLNECRMGLSVQLIAASISLLGFVSCFGIWLSLPAPARRLGLSWMAVGALYQFVRTRGFRTTFGFAFEDTR